MDMMQYILIVGGIILLSFVYQGVGMYIHSRAKVIKDKCYTIIIE